ncbi:MAG: hypothetical protein HY826_02405 [Actinobacteria bacterium]|nr:hypothetical protein [Actinomycetota bacterium]
MSPNNDLHPVTATPVARRQLFRLGGVTVASAVALAACGKSEAGAPGRVGVGEETPKLADPVVNNGVHMRTMAGIEQSIAAAYTRMIDEELLAVPSSTFPNVGDLSDVVTAFLEHHSAAATTFNELAVGQNAEPWECGNTRLDDAFISVVFDRVENGAEASDAAGAIAASDDPTRDMLNLVHTLESLSAASCQGLASQVTEPALRAAAATIGVASARQAALIALRLNPGGYVSATDAESAQPAVVATTAAPTTTQNIAAPADDSNADATATPPLTEVPLPVAIPAQFGSLAPIGYVGGAGDENGVRLKLNFETPSLNSFAYPFDVCS